MFFIRCFLYWFFGNLIVVRCIERMMCKISGNFVVIISIDVVELVSFLSSM